MSGGHTRALVWQGLQLMCQRQAHGITAKPQKQDTVATDPKLKLTWEYDEQLHCKLWQLKGHAATFSTPLLLPHVQPVWDEPPADANHALTCHDLLACSNQ